MRPVDPKTGQQQRIEREQESDCAEGDIIGGPPPLLRVLIHIFILANHSPVPITIELPDLASQTELVTRLLGLLHVVVHQ
jgi:hypothetical protein